MIKRHNNVHMNITHHRASLVCESDKPEADNLLSCSLLQPHLLGNKWLKIIPQFKQNYLVSKPRFSVNKLRCLLEFSISLDILRASNTETVI